MSKHSIMSDGLGQKGKFEPIYAGHAIEEMALSVQFNTLLDDGSFAEVRNAAEQFMQELPVRVETQGFTISPGSPTLQNSGFILRKVDVDRGINEFRVNHNSLNFKTTIYTRWDVIWAQVSGYFNALAPIFIAQARISALTITYVDKFAWTGPLVDCRPSDLLRAGSKYLSPHIFDAEDFWHSHTGAFIRASKDTKRLVNVNVDYLDELRNEGDRRIIAITTVLSDQMDQVGYEPCATDGDNINAFVNAHMQELHALDKEVLGDIINDVMSKRIALMG